MAAGRGSDGRQIGLLWGLVALALVAMSPWAAQVVDSAPACPVKSISGLPCPTCGASRAAAALAGFDPVSALRLNPLVAVAWMVLVIGGLAALVWSIGGRALPRLPVRLSQSERLAGATLLAANWLYLVVVGT